jgi:GNAT superfamily N-acetyltransferase
MDREPTIRPTTSADAEGIAEVHVDAWRWAYRGMVPDPYLASLSVTERAEAFRSWAERSEGIQIWVAESGGHTVGFAIAGPSRDEDADASTGELYGIYIKREHLHTGLGRRLLETAVTWLDTNGYEHATLWVLAENERGRAFYEAAGWTPDGSTKVEPREGFSLREVRYQRALRWGKRDGRRAPRTENGTS